MTQRGWSIDLTRCTGCNGCTAACKFENNTLLPGPDDAFGPVNYRMVIQQNTGYYPDVTRQFVTSSCNHCADPACMASCPVGAIYKREADGVVIIDNDACIGCRYCEWSCPYGAPQYNGSTHKVEKCHFCFERLDAGLQPACVLTCVGKALTMLDDFTETDGDVPPGFAPTSLTHPSVSFTV